MSNVAGMTNDELSPNAQMTKLLGKPLFLSFAFRHCFVIRH
jgi:hypothetical protein